MPNSISTRQTFDCSNCGKSYTADAWVLIDVAERPDLFVKCREKARIRAFVCPYCHNFAFEHIPLLLYYPKVDQLVFIANRRWPDEQNQDLATALTVSLCKSIKPGADAGEWQKMVTQYLKSAIILNEMQLMLGQLPKP